jgi:hypothetical protein
MFMGCTMRDLVKGAASEQRPIERWRFDTPGRIGVLVTMLDKQPVARLTATRRNGSPS